MAGCWIAFLAGTLAALRAPVVPALPALLLGAACVGVVALLLASRRRGPPGSRPASPAHGGPVAGGRALAVLRRRRIRAARWRRRTRQGLLWLLLALLGAANTAWHARAALDARLPESSRGQSLEVEAVVLGLPQALPDGWRLRLGLERPDPDRPAGVAALTARVHCGHAVFAAAGRPPRAGERWRLSLRLRPPRGLVNAGLFDHEAWLTANGIGATGSCRGAAELVREAPDGGPLAWRSRLAAALTTALPATATAALVRALAIGDESAIDAATRELLVATGTVHLISVSGLHVSLVGIAAAGLLRAGLGRLPLGNPRPGLLGAVADLAGLALAGLYVFLAGNAVPARRAFLMLGICCVLRLIAAEPRLGRVLLVALGVVLALDPLAGLAAGTWLSFLAVAVLAATGGRAAWPWPAPWSWLGPHLAVAVGLAPLLALLGEAQARVGVPANLLAIPWVGCVSTPLALLGALMELVLPGGGAWPWWLAAGSLAPVLPFLDALAALDAGGWRPLLVDGQSRIAFALLCLLLLLPRGLPIRLAALSLFLALLLPREPRPLPAGAFELEVFDVGQGTALAVRTARHLLVFDTGPPLGARLDPGRDIIAARLIAEGRRRVDRLMLSHGDLDHVSGTRGLLASLPVGGLDTATPERFADLRPPPAPCRTGAFWHWDEVAFRVLHPPGAGRSKGNDASCVLLVSGRWGRLLLPGDIEERAEYRLLRSARAALAADVVVLPHHGSRSSSTPAFVRATAARVVISTTGHGNRHGHPDPRVVRRWLRAGAVHLDTARDGALRVLFGPGGLEIRAERRDAPRWWRAGVAGG